MTSSVAGLRRSSKTLSKAKLATKKSHGHCLVVCCPSDPLQLSEYRRNRYIWEVCSANWWAPRKTAMPAASISQQKSPILLHDKAWQHVAQPILQKLNKLGYEVLPHPSHSRDLSPTDYHFFKHLSRQTFAGKMLPQTAGGRKCFPRVHWISKHRFLYYRNKTYFSLAKICWLKWFLFWLIKMCLCLVIII